jgi:hypothetical protein
MPVKCWSCDGVFDFTPDRSSWVVESKQPSGDTGKRKVHVVNCPHCGKPVEIDYPEKP